MVEWEPIQGCLHFQDSNTALISSHNFKNLPRIAPRLNKNLDRIGKLNKFTCPFYRFFMVGILGWGEKVVRLPSCRT